MEITVEVDDIEGLSGHISDVVVDEVVDEVQKQMDVERQKHSEFISNGDFETAVKSAVLNTLSTDEFQSFIKNAVIHQLASKGDAPDFERGLNAIHDMSGKDGKIVTDMVNHLIKHDTNTLRHILGDITYWYEYCEASGINTNDASRMREHFRVQAKQALNGDTDETSN